MPDTRTLERIGRILDWVFGLALAAWLLIGVAGFVWVMRHLPGQAPAASQIPI